MLGRNGIKNFTMKPVKRTYAFEEPDVPHGGSYVMKVLQQGSGWFLKALIRNWQGSSCLFLAACVLLSNSCIGSYCKIGWPQLLATYMHWLLVFGTPSWDYGTKAVDLAVKCMTPISMCKLFLRLHIFCGFCLMTPSFFTG